MTDKNVIPTGIVNFSSFFPFISGVHVLINGVNSLLLDYIQFVFFIHAIRIRSMWEGEVDLQPSVLLI